MPRPSPPSPLAPRPRSQSSKFALQGFAQSVAQELWSRRILVSQCFPPDTDTPQFAEENKLKPALTAKLSEATAVVQPDAVARAIVQGMVHWTPAISVGFDGWLLSQLTAGMGPAGSFGGAVTQWLLGGWFRAIALVYVQWFYATVAAADKVDAPHCGVAATPVFSHAGITHGMAAGAAAAAAATGAAAAAATGPGGGGAATSGSGKVSVAGLAGLAVPLVSAEDKRK
jgi:hypothetical protein